MSAQDEFADYRAIVELRHRYCHHVDAHEYDAWADLFTEDGVFDTGDAAFEGREEIRDLGHDVMDDQYDYSAHMVLNPVLRIDGDEASGQWYFFMPYTTTDGEAGWNQGVYDERYRRVDGDWKFGRIDAETRATQARETHVTF